MMLGAKHRERAQRTVRAQGGHDGGQEVGVAALRVDGRRERIDGVSDEDSGAAEGGVQQRAIEVAVLAVVPVHSVHHLLLVGRADAPHCAAHHVACSVRRHGHARALACNRHPRHSSWVVGHGLD